MPIYVTQCNKCGHWSCKEVNRVKKAVLHCRYCNKRSKLKKEGDFGLSLNAKGPILSINDASNVCREMNAGGKNGNRK